MSSSRWRARKPKIATTAGYSQQITNGEVTENNGLGLLEEQAHFVADSSFARPHETEDERTRRLKYQDEAKAALDWNVSEWTIYLRDVRNSRCLVMPAKWKGALTWWNDPSPCKDCTKMHQGALDSRAGPHRRPYLPNRRG